MLTNQIERSIETKVSAIKELDIQIADLTETRNEGSGKFMEFALDFVDNLGTNFWELTLEEVRKFKLLAFPDGFFIDSEKVIKIRSISPFIRYKDIKKSAQMSDFSKMVHLISPNLNFSSPIESCDFDELSEELNRWKDALHNDYIRWQVVHK